MFYRIISLLFIVLTSCSHYTIDDDSAGDIPVRIRLSDSPSGQEIKLMYPISVYCVNQKNLNVSSSNFDKGTPLVVKLSEGEYSINIFCGINKEVYGIEYDFEQKPVIEMKNNGVSEYPLMSAHTILEIEKATDINLIPTYIVSSVDFELENIPDIVSNIQVTISPVYKSYSIEGNAYDETSIANISCNKNGNKWISGVKYIFPSSATNTKISINMDYGNKTKNYSYTLRKRLECGKPYKFKGHFNGNSEGGNGEENDGNLELEGDFCISGWDMEEEVSIDFGDGNIDNGSDGSDGGDDGDSENGDEAEDVDIETFYVNEIPSVNDIFGPLFIWKSKEVSSKEAVVTVISPHQWPDKLASEAISTLEGYSVDEITGWRMFTESEAHEFFSDFQGGNSDINTILRENGFEVFYYEDKERYLCDNAKQTFSLYGSLRIIKAGEKTKYYLRPVKTMRLVLR